MAIQSKAAPDTDIVLKIRKKESGKREIISIAFFTFSYSVNI